MNRRHPTHPAATSTACTECYARPARICRPHCLTWESDREPTVTERANAVRQRAGFPIPDPDKVARRRHTLAVVALCGAAGTVGMFVVSITCSAVAVALLWPDLKNLP